MYYYTTLGNIHCDYIIYLYYCFRVCIAIFKLASCSEYSKVATTFGVSKTSVHRCLYMFCNAMASRKHDYIQWYSNEEAGNLADISQANYKYPQAIGKSILLNNLNLQLYFQTLIAQAYKTQAGGYVG